MLVIRLFVIVISSFVMAASADEARSGEEPATLARSVPIADMHMHLSRGRSPEHYRAQMLRNRVLWGGAVGGGPKDDPISTGMALGRSYVVALGQAEFFAVFFAGGPAALEDPQHPRFKALFETAENAFRSGNALGFGEIHINNVSPFTPAGIRRRIGLQTPVVETMFSIADRYGGFVQIHTMRSSGLDELLRTAQRFPRTKLILSHCLPGASPGDLAVLFAMRANIFCELSAQGPIHGTERVYGRSGVKLEWRELILSHADRFMLGTDPCCGLEDRYDEIVAEIRELLLPTLPPAVIRKLAYENAVRIFRLPH
jgi:hypothetical protein